jgi:hypothetical protein
MRDIPLDSILTVVSITKEYAMVYFGYHSFALPLESLEHVPHDYVSTPPPSPHRASWRKLEEGGRRRQTRRKRKGTRRH